MATDICSRRNTGIVIASERIAAGAPRVERKRCRTPHVVWNPAACTYDDQVRSAVFRISCPLRERTSRALDGRPEVYQLSPGGSLTSGVVVVRRWRTVASPWEPVMVGQWMHLHERAGGGPVCVFVGSDGSRDSGALFGPKSAFSRSGSGPFEAPERARLLNADAVTADGAGRLRVPVHPTNLTACLQSAYGAYSRAMRRN